MYLEAELGKWFMQSLSQFFPDDYGVSSWRGFLPWVMQSFSSEAPRYGKFLYVNEFHSKSASVSPIRKSKVSLGTQLTQSAIY